MDRRSIFSKFIQLCETFICDNSLRLKFTNKFWLKFQLCYRSVFDYLIVS